MTTAQPAGGRRRQGLGAWLLIAAVAIYLGLLVLLPVGALIVGAFRSGALVFIRALAAADFLNSFRLSVEISLIVVAIQLLLGTGTAWVLARQAFRGGLLLDSAIDIPFAVSPVVVGYMLLLLFGRNTLLGSRLLDLNIHIAFAVGGMTLATLYVSLPFMVREMIPVIRGLDRQQEMAARTLGSGAWVTFWRITFPALRTALIYGMTLTLARSLGEFGAVLVIGGGIQGRTETTTVYIYRALEERQYVEAYAASLALGLSSVLLVTLADRLRRRRTA
jgi:sulfate transport system permease protein